MDTRVFNPRLLVPILGLLGFLSAPLSAQSVNASGLWIGVDVGGGWGRIGCDLCTLGRELGYTGAVSFGGTIREGVRVGAEVGGWSFSEGDARQTIGSLSGVLTMYPRLGPNGIFVQGGAGLHYIKVTEADEDVDATTLGVSVGVGYELQIAPGWALVNTLNVSAASFGSLKAGDETLFDGVSNTVVRFGVGVRRH